MRILVTGAYGFIGSYVTARLLAIGHEVICCVRDVEQGKRRFPNRTVIPCDFIKDLKSEDWLSRLENIDAVVNCVGILQSHDPAVIDAIHYKVPLALIEACRQMNVKKIIHISALGVDEGVDTPYAQSKLKLEKHLFTLDYNWVILRPSLVYGPGSYGGTSLFRALSSLPWIIPIVGSGKQLFQPIHIQEVAKTVNIVIENSEISKMAIDVVGPNTLSVEELFILLRRWLGFGEAKVVHVPIGLIRLGAYLGDWFQDIPINSTTYKMLSNDNIADVKPFIKTVGFTPSAIQDNLTREPSSTQDRWHAHLYFLNPLLRISLGLVWVLSGIIPIFFVQHPVIYAVFSKIGVTGTLATLCFYGSTLLDVLLGLATLANYKLKWIGCFQILLMVFYTVFISFLLPEYWLDPFGAIMKNIPLVVATLAMMAMSDPR